VERKSNEITTEQLKELDAKPRQTKNGTDSLIQMNSSTTDATNNLKNIMKGKWSDDKRETSYGKRKRELKERIQKLMDENKKKREKLATKKRVAWADQPNTEGQIDLQHRNKKSKMNTDSVHLQSTSAVLPPPPLNPPLSRPPVDLPAVL
jgi:hypothetical protein